MAIKMLAMLTDDLDGTELKPGQGQTIRFGFQGDSYEIDLSDKNAKKFTNEIQPWISRAHRPANTSGQARSRARAARPAAAAARGVNAETRAWASENGYPKSTRGRISAQVREAYDTAH